MAVCGVRSKSIFDPHNTLIVRGWFPVQHAREEHVVPTVASRILSVHRVFHKRLIRRRER